MDKVSLSEKFRLLTDYWSPKIVGELNSQHVKLAKLKGEFIWHHHQKEDELFLVVSGLLTIQLRDREITLTEGEFFVVPAGVDHRPIAPHETHVLLLEPSSALNTGNVTNERTARDLEWI